MMDKDKVYESYIAIFKTVNKEDFKKFVAGYEAGMKCKEVVCK